MPDTRPSDTDDRVIIVGGGPVGLSAAAVLADAGVPVTVLDASPRPQTDWRASTFHAATLELLSTIDVTDEMGALGLVVGEYQLRDRRTGLVAQFDMGLLADETRFPYRLQLNQQRLVQILANRLRDRPGVDVRFGVRAVSITQGDSSAAVEAEGPHGRETLRAAYVIGADGSASTVRKQLGVDFDGMTYPQRFLIVSVADDLSDLVPGLARVAYVSDPDEWLFFLRTPESWRVVLPIPEGETPEHALSETAIQARLGQIASHRHRFDVIDRQLYAVHQRVASCFRVGRVMLIGDAAHINSPLGGMGLNSGIHDAFDLGRRLRRIWRDADARPDAELAQFAMRRRTVALDYVRADTHRNTVMMSERDPDVRRQNQAELAATAADPVRAKAFLMRASLLAAVHDQGIGEPLDGSAAPHPQRVQTRGVSQTAAATPSTGEQPAGVSA